MTLLSTVLTGLTTIGTAGALALDHEVYRRLNAWSDRSVYRGIGDRRSVALTFDDGPSPQTPALLALLQDEGIRATFFQLGMQVQRYSHIAQQVHSAGHEIGNHGWSHTSLTPQLQPTLRIPSPWRMYGELHRTQELLTTLHGRPSRFFRPPYGHHWTGLDLVQRQLGLQGVQWTVIGHDYEWNAERVAAHVLSRVVPGAIICLHDGRDVQISPDISATLAAVRIIVRALREWGYTFQTVGEMVEPGAKPPAQLLPQRSAARNAEVNPQTKDEDLLVLCE